jgi:N-acetylneuraminic acid mutarotase
MKKIKLFVLLFFITAKIQAQPYVNIPDPVFRDYIDSLVPGAIVGNDLNTTYPGLQSVGMIDVMNRGIYDLTGIQYFSNLGELYCGGNFLQDLPPLPNGISVLGCDHNQLNSLSSLPSNLSWFHCEYNQISTLPALPPNLWQLYCFNNLLTTLPALAGNLDGIWCNDCQITSLPALPPNLSGLSCGNNQLSSLPTLPNSLTYLAAAGNPDLWCLPNIPNNGNFSSDIGYLICTPQGTSDTWYKMAKNPVNDREMGVSFSIGIKCYLTTGSNFGGLDDMWAFNPATNTWTQKANLPGAVRIQATGFSIGNKGYVGLGQGSAGLFDFWEYDPASNTWVQKANYPDTAYFGNVAFAIGNKGYVGLGESSGYGFPKRFYEFDPVANTWTQKATFPGLGRTQAGCFAIGNKGYVCGGDCSNGLTNTCYSYNPSTNLWSTIASLPQNINEAASFSSNGMGYVSCGQCCYWNGTLVPTLMEYNPVMNTWTQRADLPTTGRFRGTGCAMNGRCYVGTGEKYSSSGAYMKANDWWEYTPLCNIPSNVIYASGNTAFCSGDSVMLFADNGNKYKWKMDGVNISGATSQFYYAKTTGTFKCVISDACDTVTSNQISIIVNTLPSALITPAGPTTFCSGGGVVLNAVVTSNRTYQWKKGGVNISGETLSSYTATSGGTYKVTVTNTITGCSKTSASATVITINALPTATIIPQGPTTFCAGGSVVLAANTGAGLTYKWKKGSNFISGATLLNYTATLGGTYKVEVTNSNGCSKLSAGTVVSVPCKLDGSESVPISVEIDVKVHPNPSSGDFTFEISNTGDKNIFIAVYDAIGKKIRFDQLKKSTANYHISNLPPGVFSAEIICGENKKVIKLVKTP